VRYGCCRWIGGSGQSPVTGHAVAGNSPDPVDAVRLTMNPAVDGTYGIRGISDDNGVLGNTGEVWVTFEGGISQEGPDDPNTPFDDSEFVEFLILGQTPGMISKSEEYWRWEMNTGGEWVEFDTTSGHEIYVLWDYPQPPWGPNGYYDHKTPWVKALMI